MLLCNPSLLYSLFKLGHEGVSVDGVSLVKFRDAVPGQYELGPHMCRFFRSFSHSLVEIAVRAYTQVGPFQGDQGSDLKIGSTPQTSVTSVGVHKQIRGTLIPST